MTKRSFQQLLFFIMLFFWLVFSLELSIVNVFTGSAVSVFVVMLSKNVLYTEKGPVYPLPGISVLIVYSLRLIIDMYWSGFCLLMTIIKGNADPMIFSMDLKTDNPLISTIIANSITLTPGTVTLDQQKNRLLVLSVKNDYQYGKTIARGISARLENPFLKGGLR